MPLVTTGTVKGKVKTLQITGYGQNSAEIVVVITDNSTNTDTPYTVLSDTEPMMFNSYIKLLLHALHSDTSIDISYAQTPGQTAFLSGVTITSPFLPK
jgi:hypothetical protein